MKRSVKQGSTYRCIVSSNSAWHGGGTSQGTNRNAIIHGNVAAVNNEVSGGTLEYCRTADPLFAGGNPPPPGSGVAGYRLQPGSPCIDAGTNAAAAGTADLDGNPRIVNGTIDMGAYEYTGFIDDTDGDAFTDHDEYISDTDATDSNDWFHIASVSNGTVHFDSSSNRLYSLLSTTNLVEGVWAANESRMGLGGADSMQSTNNAPAEFYKLEVRLP